MLKLSEAINNFIEKGGNEIELWRIVTALRGPDIFNDETLKTFTTCRIRAVFLQATSENDKVNSSDLDWNTLKVKPLNKLEQEQVLKLFNKTNTHFRVHIELAIQTLLSVGYKIEDLKFLLD